MLTLVAIKPGRVDFERRHELFVVEPLLAFDDMLAQVGDDAAAETGCADEKKDCEQMPQRNQLVRSLKGLRRRRFTHCS
jgi:hypothetical protein